MIVVNVLHFPSKEQYLLFADESQASNRFWLKHNMYCPHSIITGHNKPFSTEDLMKGLSLGAILETMYYVPDPDFEENLKEFPIEEFYVKVEKKNNYGVLFIDIETAKIYEEKVKSENQLKKLKMKKLIACDIKTDTNPVTGIGTLHLSVLPRVGDYLEFFINTRHYNSIVTKIKHTVFEENNYKRQDITIYVDLNK